MLNTDRTSGRTADIRNSLEWREERFTLAAGTPVKIADDLGSRRLLVVSVLSGSPTLYVTPVESNATLLGVATEATKAIHINDWMYGPLITGPWYVISSGICEILVSDVSNIT